ncbi:MAG TPA: glycerol kinase GlpK [Burkholderiales bacterium]|nr:glycerol kinase GlpK [Burkholderiales bacterium]
MRYVLALDQGTTSSRAILFDAEGNIRAQAQREFKQNFPQPGWVEHDPVEIWDTQFAVAQEAIAAAKLQARDIAALAITNQRETTVLWNRKSGAPLAPAIVWQDRRTAAHCERLKQAGQDSLIRAKTGLVLDPYFSATKLAWLLDHVPNARTCANAGELAFGTIDTWLLWQLSEGRLHFTDPTNASRTLLYDISRGQWDEGLLELFDIPASVLPEVRPSSEILGETTRFGSAIPLAGVAGDQQAALFGQACLHPGMAKNTYGTGCFMLLNTGAQLIASTHGLITSSAAVAPGTAKQYALEGSVFVAGAVVQWLRDGLGLIKRSEDIEALAASVPDAGGVYFVPAFTGLGAPHWDPHARASLHGLTRGSTAAHIAKAALESIAFQSAEVLFAMQRDAKIELRELRVDGGATVNNALMQFQADILGVPVLRPRVRETTALGAAYLGGLATGMWHDQSVIANLWQCERVFEPHMSRDEAQSRMTDWDRAVARSKNWQQ